MAHLDDLVYPILHITSQGGCDGVGKVGDPESIRNILLKRSKRRSFLRRMTDPP